MLFVVISKFQGYGDIVELLLDDGAPVNCRVTEDSSTPLHKACAGSKLGHLEAVKLLLENNADVHALNKWRETPLLTAANHGQAGAVEYLLRAGADPCKCTDTGWSPLSIAAYKGHNEVVKLLLEVGAPTEEADPTLSALLQAATKGLPDTVELLLQHDADHTVTTKKGDTALSILVEQNLIDAAVNMVTEYKASIPRCSRDRKKVQRARLLINLRLKQSGGESKNSSASRKKKKNTAEQNAKKAEEALLLELEQEDAERTKQAQDANKKSAKKRKKKERERQLKKEQEEKRLAEEKKEEERRRKIQQEKEAAERAERQRLAEAQRKEEEENRRKQEKAMREQQKKEREQRKKLQKEEEERRKLKQQKEANEIAKKNNAKTVGSNGSSKPSEVQRQTPFQSSNQAKPSVPKSNASANMNKRGWESLPSKNSVAEPVNVASKNDVAKPKIPLATPTTFQKEEPYVLPLNVNESMMKNGSAIEDAVVVNQQQQINAPLTPGRYNTAGTSADVTTDPMNIFSLRVEPPAVSVFRREKVSELLHRFSAAKATTDALGSVNLVVAKKVLFRWIMRAAHDSDGYVDFIIPSWDDLDKLTVFFQRQFISETRKIFRASTSMEALKEAGTVTAHLCHAIAKEVADFHRRVLDQLPADWNDTTIGVSVSEIPSNIGESTVVINWANQARVTLSGSVFLKLKERFQGVQTQLLSSIFVCKTCYDTKLLLVEDTSMDYSLTPNARLSLASELAVSAEVWSDPFAALNRNSFWGQFAEIDRMFGGMRPFGTSDDFLIKQGGSVSVLAPPDSMLASRYLNRMMDILASCDQSNVAVSFAVFLRSECLVNQKSPPSTDDIYMLEPRLRDRTNYISRVETLVEGAHSYFSDKIGGSQASTTPSLFVLLQNSLGKNRFPIRNVGILEILASSETRVNRMPEPALPTPLTYAPITGPSFLQTPANLPASPTPPQTSISSDFGLGAIGGAPILPTSFGQDSSSAVRRTGPRRGRLFDLVDNGEEDTMNDVDVVSGMLGTLNVDDLFQQDVDIEAISLMGIGGSTGFQPRSNKTQGRFG